MVIVHQESAVREVKSPPTVEEPTYGFRKLLDAVKDVVPVERLANDLGAKLKGTRGFCPIHRGENPTAFSVQPEQGRWYCFRCGEGGDVLDLWERVHGYTDRKLALMDLAGEYGVEAPERPESRTRRHDRQEKIREAIEREKVEHIRMLVFRLIWMPWLRTLPVWVREEAKVSAWSSSHRIAKLLYEGRSA